MIPEGSRVLLVDSRGKKFLLRTFRKMIEVQGLGVVDGCMLCDSEFGGSITIGAKEFVAVKPSLSDLVSMITRKTQVMLPKDSFQIPFLLDIGAGSKVVEAGVGSGAMTLVLLHAVAPTGKVTSYEMRDDHASVARRNVVLSEHERCWELRLDDVCTAELGQDVDAAVLDMPNPWDALDNVVSSLRAGGYCCCYVPNINQLEATVSKMRDLRMSEVVAFETIQREMVVHDGGVRPSFEMLGHTGYIAMGRKMPG